MNTLTLSEAIRRETDAVMPRLVSLRRFLHAHPELSGQEYQTAACVATVLTELGLEVHTQVGRTGVVAMLYGQGKDSRTIGIRADMDALPIVEQTGLPHQSQANGVMHACGHDLHTTIALGTAMVLTRLRELLPGQVKFLFQPAEETSEGAQWLLQAGVLRDPVVDALFALHCLPSLPTGIIGTRTGVFTAAADALEIEVLGRSGHGARPHEAVDAIWVAANIMTSLQQGISRMHNPLRPVVLTIGQIKGGRAPNIICDHVTLTGTVRSLDPETRTNLPIWIEQIIAQTCAAFGAQYRLNYSGGTPSLINDPRLTYLVESCVRDTFGPEHLYILPEPSMGAEDFAVLTEHVPGTMFRLGVGQGINHPLHHPGFDCGDEAIPYGVSTLCAAALQFWNLPDI